MIDFTRLYRVCIHIRNSCMWRVRTLSRLITQIWPMCVIAAICLIVVEVAEYAPSKPNLLRFTGLVLELVGVFIVGVKIIGSQKRFGRRGLVDSTRIWLASLFSIFRRRKVAEARLNIDIGRIEGKAGEYEEPNLDPEMDHTKLILRIEEFLVSTNRRIDDLTKRQKAEFAELKAAHGARIAEATNQTNHLKKLVEQSLVDGLNAEIFGLALVVIGLTLATIPDELSIFL